MTVLIAHEGPEVMYTTEYRETRLPRSGYSVRIRQGAGYLTILELYANGELLDVAVARSLASALLRGAVRGGPPDDPWALAWGQLPPGQPDVAVVFAGGEEPPLPVQPDMMAGAFWLAEVGGDHLSVSVAAGFDRATGRLIHHEASS